MLMRHLLVFFLLFSFNLGPAGAAHGQQSSGEGMRVIVRKVAPKYPEIARRMSISGTVKVVAVVEPDGKVKSVEAAGGHPLLIQAAQAAISQWKFAPASAESREPVELHFNANSQ